jgi:putative Mg2+ transporter-C (MgtC) family protein
MDLIDTNWLLQLEVATKVVIAGFLGGLVGLERELANRPAGLRTHAVLAAAAALLVGVTDLLIGHFADETSPAIMRADPIRVVEAIVTGVGFIGAGTIFRHRHDDAVEGLTTAASMLLVAAIGVAVAMGQLLLAAIVTVLTLVLLRIVGTFVRNRSRVHQEKRSSER